MLLFLLCFIIWAAVHSITASSRFKGIVIQWAGRRFYDAWYRLFYNVFSAASILPLLIIGSLEIPNRTIWEIDSPLRYVFLAIQLVGLAGLVISLWQTGFLQFSGIAQVLDYLMHKTEQDIPKALVTDGTFGIVRHPLYFFSLLVIWFFPTMTLQLLVFNTASTIYFVIGSIHEERRLQASFGADYEAYRAVVPALLPIRIRFFKRS